MSFTNRFLASCPVLAFAALVTLNTGCAADSGEPPAESEEVGSDESNLTRLSGGLSNSGSARCYTIECPGDGLDSCFIPCMKRPGTTRSACVSACQCKSIEIVCEQKSAM